MSTDTGANKSPLVIFCLDAGDPILIRRWIQEGCLPALETILRNGCSANTVGPELISEHGIWVSLFSGITRGIHGYYDFRQLDPGTYRLQGRTAKDAKAIPFWNCFQGTSTKVAIIDAQDVFPLDGLQGLQLANWATHEPVFGPEAKPPQLLDEVRRIFGPQMKVEINWTSDYAEDKRIYRALMERLKKKGMLCRELLKKDQFDLIVIGFGEAHTGGHQLWKYMPEAQEEPGKVIDPEMTNAIREIYRAVDDEIGRLLSQLPSNSNVFLVTSAGMENHYPTSGLVESFCRVLGYQAAFQPSVSSSGSMSPLALIRKLLPESLRVAISRHFPRDVRERLLSDQFMSGTNWSETTAFAIPSFYAGNIRINLKDREPQGTVTGDRYEEILQEIKRNLMQLIDPKTGEPAVRWVPAAGELFGVPQPVHLPDLFVKWKPHSHYMEKLAHSTGELSQKPDFLRDSGHSDLGFLAAAGPAIRGRGEIGDVQLLDLVPTFLSLLEGPVSKEMSGKPVHAILEG